MNVLTIIPAKGASTRLKRKNIRLLAGKPLIAYTIETAKASGLCGEIMVSTEDHEIAEIAKELGAEVPFMRPDYLSHDPYEVDDVCLYVLKQYEEIGRTFDTLIILLPTSPLCIVEDIKESVRIFHENDGKFLMSASEMDPHYYNALIFDEETSTLSKLFIDEQDVAAVCSVLRSDWLTTGPKVEEFEKAVADYVGSKYAVAVNSGTAALHCAMYAIGIGPGDEVIVPPMTFAATANCIVFQGGTPVFADVTRDTLLIDPAQVEAKITPRTKAIIAVDYAGQPCEYDSLRNIADQNNLILVADACHALGAEYKGQKTGSLADLNVFSFHPVKHITTGEGGMITTDDAKLAERMRLFRNHGIIRDPSKFLNLQSSIFNPLRPLTSSGFTRW